jgi:HEPN domain-containing protein
MSGIADPLAWVERAEEDYAIARFALRRKPPFTYSACFHAQQCAEKYLKALLVAGGYTFSKVHDLLVLHDECARAGIIVAISDDHLSTLSYFAVRVRYPGDDPIEDEARQAVKIAGSVRKFAQKWMGLNR